MHREHKVSDLITFKLQIFMRIKNMSKGGNFLSLVRKKRREKGLKEKK